MSIRNVVASIALAVALVAAARVSMAATPGAAPSNPPATGAASAGGARNNGAGRFAPRGDGEGRAGPAARGGRGGAPAIPATLESAMSDMNRMLRALKTEAADPAKAEQTLTDLITFQRDVAISKALVPPTVNRLPAAEKAKSLASYRAMMNGLTRTLLDLEDAVNDKKPDDIKKLLAQLDQIEKQGHAEFKPAGD